MLTLNSIIAATGGMTAYGEGMRPPVPRDRGARPRASHVPVRTPIQHDEDADPADRDA